MHSRFVDRLAKIYTNKLINKGNNEAKAWAERFLTRDDLLAVAQEVKVLLKKRGFRVPE